MNELQKTIEMQRKDIQDLKLRHKDEILSLEKERNLLLMETKELEFKQKQQRLMQDAEKLEMMNKIIKLEADRLSAEKELKSRSTDLAQMKSLQQIQSEAKIQELHRKIDLLKEEHANEVKLVRQEGDKSLIELKVLYEQEIDSLKNQLSSLSSKFREKTAEIDSLREKDSALKAQISVMEEALSHYKTLHKSKPDKEEFRSFNSDFFMSKDSLSSRPFRNMCEDDINLPFNPKIPVEFQKFVNEIERLRSLNEKILKEKEENEKKLKNEIKYLIGKLLKAKSKISAEGELTGSLRRESMLNTLRSTGFNRTSLPLRSSRRTEKD
jgi:hypothetical protein